MCPQSIQLSLNILEIPRDGCANQLALCCDGGNFCSQGCDGAGLQTADNPKLAILDDFRKFGLHGLQIFLSTFGIIFSCSHLLKGKSILSNNNISLNLYQES